MLTEKDKEFLERLRMLMEERELSVSLKPDRPSYMVLRGTYGEKIHKAFRMTRQSRRHRPTIIKRVGEIRLIDLEDRFFEGDQRGVHSFHQLGRVLGWPVALLDHRDSCQSFFKRGDLLLKVSTLKKQFRKFHPHLLPFRPLGVVSRASGSLSSISIGVPRSVRGRMRSVTRLYGASYSPPDHMALGDVGVRLPGIVSRAIIAYHRRYGHMGNILIGILGSRKDAGKGEGRWRMWRPTVALCQQRDLPIARVELLYSRDARSLVQQVAGDIVAVSPATEVVPTSLELDDPWISRRSMGGCTTSAMGTGLTPKRTSTSST